MSDHHNEVRILQGARNFPIYECLINPGWQEIGHARILLSRKMPNGHVVFGMYLVDLYCLGLKDTFCNADWHQYRYETEMKAQAYFDQPAQPCAIHLAHSIIYGSIHYAQQLGFSPEKEFQLSRYVLEPEENIKIKNDIQFGFDGRPLYIRGPHDDVERIIRTLEKTVGDGNFSAVCEEDGDILGSIQEMTEAGYIRSQKVGRNDLCPCSSNKKYKRCCGA